MQIDPRFVGCRLPRSRGGTRLRRQIPGRQNHPDPRAPGGRQRRRTPGQRARRRQGHKQARRSPDPGSKPAEWSLSTRGHSCPFPRFSAWRRAKIPAFPPSAYVQIRAHPGTVNDTEPCQSRKIGLNNRFRPQIPLIFERPLEEHRLPGKHPPNPGFTTKSPKTGLPGHPQPLSRYRENTLSLSRVQGVYKGCPTGVPAKILWIPGEHPLYTPCTRPEGRVNAG